jgi:hypothetical protein
MKESIEKIERNWMSQDVFIKRIVVCISDCKGV